MLPPNTVSETDLRSTSSEGYACSPLVCNELISSASPVNESIAVIFASIFFFEAKAVKSIFANRKVAPAPL